MNDSSSKAWLARPDGSLILGHGPFTASERPPEDGVAFFLQRYGLDESKPWQVPASFERLDAQEFAERNRLHAAPGCAWNELDAGPFAGVFQEVMDAIRRGVFEKTVPVVVEEGHLESGTTADLAAAMTGQGQPRLAYAWMAGEHGFAGATPEVLFSLEGSRLKTMALAGTARREERAVFAVDEKEIREHEYVAQSLVAKLGDIGHVRRGERTILDLGMLVHFLSPIEVDLDHPHGPAELIRRLHPTPALGPLHTHAGDLGPTDRLATETGMSGGIWSPVRSLGCRSFRCGGGDSRNLVGGQEASPSSWAAA